MVDPERDWLAPPYVLGAAFDGCSGYFVSRPHAGAFLNAHSEAVLVMHHAPFDLAVLHDLVPDAGVYDRVDSNAVYDTRILHQLHALASTGDVAANRGESTLERCTEVHLGSALPKDVADSAGRIVRTSYSRWLQRPATEIEPVYLDYLAKDVIATFRVFEVLRAKIKTLLDGAVGVWSSVSRDWLQCQSDEWGPQTHHIQLKAAVSLRAVTANGLTLDRDAQGALAVSLECLLKAQRDTLRCGGYLPGEKGAGKALQVILRGLEARNPGVEFPRTPAGKYATGGDALAELADRAPFLKDLSDYKATEKLLGSFVGKLRRPVIHPSFRPLVRTGRTASFGELNAQNLPRDDAVRGCIVPSPGHVFIMADYATLEMATLAQVTIGQFGQRSAMAEAINGGRDLHRMVAAQLTGKPESEVTDDERRMAKPINFGKPGAMGNAALKHYAKSSYGVEMSDAQVERLSAAWLSSFPEMEKFLENDRNAGDDVAGMFGLTPASHFEHTGSRKFLNHPNNQGNAHTPHGILGWMMLRTVNFPSPETQVGVPYDPEDIDYFWSRVNAMLDLLPPKMHADIKDRCASPKVRAAVRALVGRGPVFTLTGRLRANATFAARRNTTFQGLAADGAKIALWQLWRAGYRVVNFIHDEFLIEVPKPRSS